MTASRRVLPALNAGAFEAEMAMLSPVRGLRPWRTKFATCSRLTGPDEIPAVFGLGMWRSGQGGYAERGGGAGVARISESAIRVHMSRPALS